MVVMIQRSFRTFPRGTREIDDMYHTLRIVSVTMMTVMRIVGMSIGGLVLSRSCLGLLGLGCFFFALLVYASVMARLTHRA
jgi:hypothetical protein